MKKYDPGLKSVFWAAVIILCTATIPHLIGRTHEIHDFNLVRYLGMACMFIFVFPIVGALIDGTFGRLIPTWILRHVLALLKIKKEHVVITLMAIVTVLWNMRHHSLIRSLGDITVNLIFLSVFFRKGFWPSVTTNMLASMIVGIILSVLVLFRQQDFF